VRAAPERIAPPTSLLASPLAALLAGLLSLGSCSRAVEVELGPGTEARWKALVQEHPLPNGYRWTQAGQTGAARGPRLAVGLREWDDPPPPDGSRVLESVTLAATVDLLSPREAIGIAELRNADDARVVPLDQVVLPRRLVEVAGSYPGDAGYPLGEELYAGLSSPDPALERWLRERSGDSSGPAPLVWVAAVGDTLLDRGVDRLLSSGEAGIERVFGDTLPLLRGADLVAGNLEGAVTLRTRPAAKAYTFRAVPEALRGLASAGFDYLTLTNNHSFDFGAEGFTDTLEHLRAAGIGTSGAGRDAGEALEPWVRVLGGSAVRLWSLAAYPVEGSGWDGRATRAGAATPGVLWADEETASALRIELASKPAEGVRPFDVLLVHGGEEWHSAPAAAWRRLYRSLASSGAELVLGSHPHVLQGMEAYHGSLILYSLGNFLFPGMEGMAGATDGVIAMVGLSEGRIVAVRLVPVTLAGTTVRLAASSAARLRVLALSRALPAVEEP
jgi:hypothetical protein